MALEIKKIEIRRVPDERTDLSWLTDESRYDALAPELAEMGKALDAARVATYGADWWYVGVLARAVIVVAGVPQTISSRGAWGIESDSPGKYFAEVGAAQLDELARVLRELGASEDAIVTTNKEGLTTTT